MAYMEKATLADRLNTVMRLKGFTQASLAEAVGMAQPSIWKLTTGKAKSSRKIIDIANALSVDPLWLSTGDGEPPEFFKREDVKDGIPVAKVKAKGIAEWDDLTPLEDDEVEIPYYKSIELAAGNGCTTNEDHNGFKLRFSKSTLRRYGIIPSETMAFPVHGDSMSPVIPDGSTVMVSKMHNNIIDGGIYAIEQDGLFRVKLLYRQPGGELIIRSYNSTEFPDEFDNIENVKIIGRVFNWSVMGW